MLRPGSVFDGRFRVLDQLVAAATPIALAEELNGGRRVWLVLVSVTATAIQISTALEQQSRFALGVPGLARPVASGVDGGLAFVAFAAPEPGCVSEGRVAAWDAVRVARLAQRMAAALGPLHDQGIAHGSVRPELTFESEHGDVALGFGVAALATRFGAPGEASQLLAPSYRAPELREALLPPTPQSDIYALGVLLRALLLAPELAENANEAELGFISPALQALLARTLAPEPRARFADVRAFAAELTRLAALDALDVPSPALVTAPALSVLEAPAPAESAADEIGAARTAEGSVPPILPPILPPTPPATTPPARSSSAGALMALLVVVGGFVLMVGGVLGATVLGMRHAHPLRTSVSVPAHRSPPTGAAPLAPSPSPSSSEGTEPVPPVTAGPKKHRPAQAAISHAPLVAPGVGPSSFPEEAHAALPIAGSEPIWGTRSAPLTWVLFGDLDCPHTRHAWRALEATKLNFGDDLRIVFRHRPLREHPYALAAARALAGLELLRGPAAFFAVLHKIAQDDAPLSDERLLEALSSAGYGALPLRELARTGEPTVRADLELAGQFGVRATPLSFVNGLRVDGERTPGEVERLLLDERRATTWALASGASAKELYATRTSSNLIGVGDQEPSRVCAPVADSPVRGPADALVTLVEFSDFECPYCKQVEPTLKTLLARYPRTLRLVWKDYPLPQHKGARLLANFAADAGSRGSNASFWTVHDGLFTAAGEIDEALLGGLAGKAGLDGALLLSAARSGVHDPAIRADVTLGERLGVNGTPTFFANGHRIQGALGIEQFDALIRSELGLAERIVLRGVARDELYRLVCDAE